MIKVGRVLLDNFKVYYRDLPIMLEADARCHLCGSSDEPTLWIDLEEAPSWVGSEPTRWQLHIGVTAMTIHQEPTRKSNVKDHIDIYIPDFNIPDLIHLLRRAMEKSKPSSS